MKIHSRIREEAALNTGIQKAQIIQDSDLEYDRREDNILIKLVIEGFADTVYGSRCMGSPDSIFLHTNKESRTSC